MFLQLLSRLFLRTIFQDDEILLQLSREGGPDDSIGMLDEYIFTIKERKSKHRVGYVSVRVGESPALYYLGHIGYRIDPPFRGNGYARKACLLLTPLLKQLQFSTIVITTDVDNLPSRKTCHNIGCILEHIAKVPPEHIGVCAGSKEKCRYIWKIQPQFTR